MSRNTSLNPVGTNAGAKVMLFPELASIKTANFANFTNYRHLRSFLKTTTLSLEERPRKFNGVEVWPVEQFFMRLWSGKVL